MQMLVITWYVAVVLLIYFKTEIYIKLLFKRVIVLTGKNIVDLENN